MPQKCRIMYIHGIHHGINAALGYLTGCSMGYHGIPHGNAGSIPRGQPWETSQYTPWGKGSNGISHSVPHRTAYGGNYAMEYAVEYPIGHLMAFPTVYAMIYPCSPSSIPWECFSNRMSNRVYSPLHIYPRGYGILGIT